MRRLRRGKRGEGREERTWIVPPCTAAGMSGVRFTTAALAPCPSAAANAAAFATAVSAALCRLRFDLHGRSGDGRRWGRQRLAHAGQVGGIAGTWSGGEG